MLLNPVRKNIAGLSANPQPLDHQTDSHLTEPPRLVPRIYTLWPTICGYSLEAPQHESPQHIKLLWRDKKITSTFGTKIALSGAMKKFYDKYCTQKGVFEHMQNTYLTRMFAVFWSILHYPMSL